VPIYLVGQPYVAGRMRWPPAARYSYRCDGHELILFVRGVTDRQEADLRRGQAELALVVDARAIVLCSRFGATLPWSHAAPYRWCGVPRAERGVPPAPELMPDRHAQLRVALVEADDGRVRALRAVRLTPAFTTALHAAIRAQASRPAPAVAAVSRVARLYHEPPPAGFGSPGAAWATL
jgi:hypothetical protein